MLRLCSPRRFPQVVSGQLYRFKVVPLNHCFCGGQVPEHFIRKPVHFSHEELIMSELVVLELGKQKKRIRCAGPRDIHALDLSFHGSSAYQVINVIIVSIFHCFHSKVTDFCPEQVICV